jgi:hypothetical protein
VKEQTHSMVRLVGSVVGIVLIAATLVGCAGYVPGRQAYWDAQVKEMCEKDGGVIVYERVPLPKQYLGADGAIKIPPKPSNPERPLDFEAKATDLFYYEWIHEPIQTGNLAVGKHTFRVIRSSDKKILGTLIVYSRSGGDIPVYDHPSSFTCPDAKSRPDVLNLIFIR